MDTVIQTGQPAPLFELPDLTGRTYTLRGLTGQIVILNFWSAECPWSERVDQTLLPLLENWGKNVIYLPVATNANEPLEQLRLTAEQRGLLVVLLDSNHRVADAYGAQTTPHFFLIDPVGMLRYQGSFDDVTFEQRTPTVSYLELAVGALLRGEQPDPAFVSPYGCAIVRGSET